MRNLVPGAGFALVAALVVAGCSGGGGSSGGSSTAPPPPSSPTSNTKPGPTSSSPTSPTTSPTSSSTGSQPLAPPNAPTSGPYTHVVRSATSADGLAFTDDGLALIQHASVPCAIVTSNSRIRIYYVDASQGPETANVAESSDQGKTFTTLGLTIAGLPSGKKALDPSIVRLADGRFRLYFYMADQQGTVDSKTNHDVACAVSTDGVQFTYEQVVFTYPGLVDPDVFYTGTRWQVQVFSLTDGKTVVATSNDGLSFTYAGPIDANVQGYGVVAPVKLADGRFRMFAFKQPGGSTFVSFVSTDALAWTLEAGTRLTVSSGGQITDPFAVQLGDGTWKMFYKQGN